MILKEAVEDRCGEEARVNRLDANFNLGTGINNGRGQLYLECDVMGGDAVNAMIPAAERGKRTREAVGRSKEI